MVLKFKIINWDQKWVLDINFNLVIRFNRHIRGTKIQLVSYSSLWENGIPRNWFFNVQRQVVSCYCKTTGYPFLVLLEIIIRETTKTWYYVIFRRKVDTEKSELQMGFEPTTLCDPVGCSHHWATGDSVVSKGQILGIDWVSTVTILDSEKNLLNNCSAVALSIVISCSLIINLLGKVEGTFGL